MTADPTPTSKRSKKAEPGREALPWWRHAPVKDSQTVDWLPGRLVKLRAQLRNLYWSNQCRPLVDADVATLRKRLVQIDALDVVSDAELAELLSTPFGFEAGPDGWRIPELEEHRTHADESRQRASAAGSRGAASRWGRKQSVDGPMADG